MLDNHFLRSGGLQLYLCPFFFSSSESVCEFVCVRVYERVLRVCDVLWEECVCFPAAVASACESSLFVFFQLGYNSNEDCWRHLLNPSKISIFFFFFLNPILLCRVTIDSYLMKILNPRVLKVWLLKIPCSSLVWFQRSAFQNCTLQLLLSEKWSKQNQQRIESSHFWRKATEVLFNVGQFYIIWEF